MRPWIEHLGWQEIIRQTGLKDFIDQVGVQPILDQVGLAKVAAEMTPEQRQEMLRLLGQAPPSAEATHSQE